MSIFLRFVRHNDPCSDVIISYTGGSYSHVEAVLPGGGYIGAFGAGYKTIPAGVSVRPMDYDAGKYADQKLLELQADAVISEAFYAYLIKHVGVGYDWGGLGSFVHVDLHQDNHVFCSEFIVLGLRDSLYFHAALPIAASGISPRDLDLGYAFVDNASQISLFAVFGAGVYSLAINDLALTLRAPLPPGRGNGEVRPSSHQGYYTSREFDPLVRGQQYIVLLLKAIIHNQKAPISAVVPIVTPADMTPEQLDEGQKCIILLLEDVLRNQELELAAEDTPTVVYPQFKVAKQP